MVTFKIHEQKSSSQLISDPNLLVEESLTEIHTSNPFKQKFPFSGEKTGEKKF